MREKSTDYTVKGPRKNTSNTSNTSNAGGLPVLTGVPGWAHDAVKRAAELSQAARAAALAGDHDRARELRAEYDRLYDDIEAQAEALAGLEAQPAGVDIDLLRVVT